MFEMQKNKAKYEQWKIYKYDCCLIKGISLIKFFNKNNEN